MLKKFEMLYLRTCTVEHNLSRASHNIEYLILILKVLFYLDKLITI